MKTIITSLVLISLMITSAAWAGKDSTSTRKPVATATFKAWVSDLSNDTLAFRITNPERDKVTVKVYSDYNTKVLNYNLGHKEAVRVLYVMDNMRPCTYTAVVERNGKEVLRKAVELK